MKSSRIRNFSLWVILTAEVILLLLPRTILDLRVIRFFITANDQPAFEGKILGMDILMGMMAIELFSLFILWWLALRCTKITIKEIPAYIWVGAAFSVAGMLNFVLPILWALVAIPLFTTPNQFWLLQGASLIVTPIAFAIMYGRGKQMQRNGQSPDTPQALEASIHNDKNNPKWQRGLIAVVVVVLAGYVFMQPASKPYLTLEEASKLHYPVSVKGAAFDIPLTYTRTGGSIIKGGGYFNTWESPTHNEIEGIERKEIDCINVAALMPDMSPYTVENAAEFDRLGWGRRVTILFCQRNHLDLEKAYRNKEALNSSKLRDMLQYEAITREQDQFISPDYLIGIRCDNTPQKEGWYPSCEVLRPYAYKQKNGNKNLPMYLLRYHFSAEYKQQWREIDEQVVALFDRFAASAQQH